MIDADYHFVGAVIGPHLQHKSCCVMDFATKVVSFDDISKEMLTNVMGVSEEIVSEINKLRTNPTEYINMLHSRYDAFIDDEVYQLVDGTRIRTKEGKKCK